MAADSAPGVDGYEFVAPIGSGGMGAVWLARDLALDRLVAIKLLPSDVTTDPARVARLRLEARAASALNHPNVCTIHALGTAADGQLFLALSVYEVTPENSQGKKLGGTEIEGGAPLYADRSPDGSSLAVLLPRDKAIRVLTFSDGRGEDVPITSPLDVAPFFWSIDNAGWYVSSTGEYPAGTQLLHIDRSGKSREVASQNVRSWMSGIPSPSGTQIAITRANAVSNVWLVKGF